MKIIASHVNTDFDALASLVAASKLHPDATMAIPAEQSDAVKQFLAIYRDKLELTPIRMISWDEVTELILVDVASLSRIGVQAKYLNQANMNIIVYDHHPPRAGDVTESSGAIELVGATVTLLVEKIQKRQLPISSFEATIFGLGLYSDTGSFTYSHTTERDLRAASFLMEHNMNLEIIQRFSEEVLFQQQQRIFQQLFQDHSSYKMNGLSIVLSSYEQKDYQGGLATLTRMLLETTNADAVITIVQMGKRVYIIGRASSERVNFLPLLSIWGGGGHPQAGSANVKNANMEEVVNEVEQQLPLIIKPAITAKDIMSSPVQTISPELTLQETSNLMLHYGHRGFPVVEDGQLVGIISKRDLDKAMQHKTGHAPVKAYMSTDVITVSPDTPMEDILLFMMKHNIGRLPVIDGQDIIGIISRTNMIGYLHRDQEGKGLK